MQTPLISVIMPTHNRAHLVGRAIQCVLNQTFVDYELIIVDDASRDNTEEVVKSFGDERIVYIRRDKNRGASAARNTGIRQARAELITFLDDDDESYPDLLGLLFHAFEGESEEVGFGWTGIHRIEQRQDEEVLIEEWSWSADVKQSQPLVYLFVGTSYGLAVRKSCFDVIGLFDESLLHSNEDFDLLIRLGERFDFVVVPGVHVKLHNHAGSQLTDLTPEKVNELEQVIRKHSRVLQRNQEAWFLLYDELVRAYYLLNDKHRARLAFLKMARQIPGRKLMWARFFHRELKNAKVTLKRAFSSGPLAYLR